MSVKRIGLEKVGTVGRDPPGEIALRVRLAWDAGAAPAGEINNFGAHARTPAPVSRWRSANAAGVN